MSDATVFNDAREALRAQLLTVLGLPTARKWEGESLEPPTDAAWIRETMLRRAPPRRRTIGAQPRFELVLLYQVDLFQPTTTSSGVEADIAQLELDAGAIAAAFPTTDDLVFGSVRVHVRSAGLGRVDEGTPHNKIAVTIEAVASWWASN